MEGYTVIARRYRPQSFGEVVGQEHVARTLKNAILEGRVGHAYLFAGPRGVGKTSMARIFAKALNCAKGPTETPCGTCEICLAVADGSDPDVVEIDAASSRHIEDVQALREKVLYAPLRARFKVYILDEAHQMSKDAFNALLKTLEEPPPHVKFVFATTDPLKLPETILSRCQRFDFRRNAAVDIRECLRAICVKEAVTCPDEVLSEISAAADGSMRDAQSLLDQLLAYAEGAITPEDVTQLLGTLPHARVADFFRAVAARDARGVLERVQAIFDGGRDPAAVCDQAVGFLRDALLAAACGPSAPGLDLVPEARPRVEAAAKDFSPETLMYFMQLLAEARRRIKEGLSPRLALEVASLKMARWEDLASVADLAARLEGAPPAAQRTSVAAPPPSSRPATAAAPDPRPPQRPAPPERMLPPPAGTAEGDPESAAPAPEAGDFQRAWPKILDRVKEARTTLAACLREARPESIEGTEMTVSFPVELRFHMGQVEVPEHRRMVEEAATSVLGRAVTLHCTLVKGPSAGLGAGPPAGIPLSDSRGAGRVEGLGAGSPGASGPLSVSASVKLRQDTSASAEAPLAAAAPRAAPRPLQELAADPGVRRVMQIFEGHVVNAEKE